MKTPSTIIWNPEILSAGKDSTTKLPYNPNGKDPSRDA